MLPILFRIHGIPFHSYGLMVVAGFAVAMWWSVRECERHDLPREMMLDYATYCLVTGIVFARILFVTLNWQDYAGDPVSVFRIQEGGLSFHGALFGGIVAMMLFSKIRKRSFWLLADVVSPCVILGYPLARLGCLLNGCCYGTPTGLPWGLRFPDVLHPGHWTPPSHPAQVYSSLLVFALFFVYIRLNRFVHVNGQRFCFMLVVFAVDRFVMEIFRRGATAKITPVLALTQAQWLSIIMVIVAMLIYRRLDSRRPAGETVAGATE